MRMLSASNRVKGLLSALTVTLLTTRGNTKGAWLPLCEALLGVLRGALPQAIPAYVFGGYGRPSGLRQSCATGGIR